MEADDVVIGEDPRPLTSEALRHARREVAMRSAERTGYGCYVDPDSPSMFQEIYRLDRVTGRARAPHQT